MAYGILDLPFRHSGSSFWPVGFSLIVAHELRCFMAGGMLVPRPETEPESPALESRFLTTS